ncbi:hypothetical protein EG68_09889 [Paragonimus skrjabini miyazakii]|uniref:Ribosomal protein eL8/eL30/eS12/Gadd45 domain-containing protein n=1 Tax=Paragonimus skrjabini miyazakii TaxID=59628 RepID=A0A8S9YSY3_9TREM|nr:hypothetical protein EG68_09889 [Paragonimus skrjabini miyazakii]
MNSCNFPQFERQPRCLHSSFRNNRRGFVSQQNSRNSEWSKSFVSKTASNHTDDVCTSKRFFNHESSNSFMDSSFPPLGGTVSQQMAGISAFPRNPTGTSSTYASVLNARPKADLKKSFVPAVAKPNTRPKLTSVIDERWKPRHTNISKGSAAYLWHAQSNRSASNGRMLRSSSTDQSITDKSLLESFRSFASFSGDMDLSTLSNVVNFSLSSRPSRLVARSDSANRTSFSVTESEAEWMYMRSKGKKANLLEITPLKPVKVSTPKKKRDRSKYRSLSMSTFFDYSSDSFTTSKERKYDAPLVLPLEELLQPIKPASPPKKPLGALTWDAKLGPINETKRIGKVREVPKTKRPSRLKRALISEREARHLQRSCSAPPNTKVSNLAVIPVNGGHKSVNEDQPKISHTNNVLESSTGRSIPTNLPTISKEQENLVAEFMKQLAHFQDRSFVKFANAPYHRKRSKRFVCGLREVIKHLRLKHLRLVLVARNLERGAINRCWKLQTEPTQEEVADELGTLEQILVQIWQLALESDPITPILITHNRHTLARLCHKPGRVSVVGVLSVAGAEQTAKQLLALNTGVNLPKSISTPLAAKGPEEQNDENSTRSDCSVHKNELTHEQYL